MARYFTADLHFGHRNIIRYENRPWPDTDVMDGALISRINATCGSDDELWIVGDVSLSGAAAAHLAHIDARVILVPGNHDKCWPGNYPTNRDRLEMRAAQYRGFGADEVIVDRHPELDLRAANGAMIHVRVAHVPYRDGLTDRDAERMSSLAYWTPLDDGTPLVCGHVHSAWAEKTTAAGTPMVNVGVDVRDWWPVPEDVVAGLLIGG